MALLGPRQCGKTTLAREVAQIRNAEYFDLEDPTDLARLAAPKLTLEQLNGLAEQRDLESHPIYGASWEGLCVEEIVRRYGDTNCWFWAIHGGVELDVMAQYRGRRIGFECKLTDAPRVTKSMRRAADDLQLDHLYVVYPGDLQFVLDEGVTAMPLTRLHQIDGP